MELLGLLAVLIDPDAKHPVCEVSTDINGEPIIEFSYETALDTENS